MIAPGAGFQPFTDPPRDVSLAAVARESTTIPVVSQGVSGDFVALRIARTTNFAFDPAQHGIVATGGPFPARYLILGTLTGTLTSSLALGPVPATSGNVYRLQALHLATDGSRWLSDPRSLVVLDSSF